VFEVLFGERVDLEKNRAEMGFFENGTRKLNCGGLMNFDIKLFNNYGERWGRQIGLGGGNGNGLRVFVNLTLC